MNSNILVLSNKPTWKSTMDFDFVVTSDDPSNPSSSNRQVIRQRASQAGARTRRREARFTGVNLLQLPPWLVPRLAPSQAESIDQPDLEPSEHGMEVQPYHQSYSSHFRNMDRLAQPIARPLSISPQRSIIALRQLLEFSKHDMSKTLL